MIVYIKETNRYVDSNDIPVWIRDKYHIDAKPTHVETTFYEKDGVISCKPFTN